MSASMSAARPRFRLLLLGGLLAVLAMTVAAAMGRRAVAQDVPIAVENIELVSDCQIRAFMPSYRPGTPLLEIANDIEGGNPRFWFMHQGPVPVPLPTALFDPASAERSVVDVLTEEAGFVCVDYGTIWHRPLFPPPPCVYQPPYCLEPQPQQQPSPVP